MAAIVTGNVVCLKSDTRRTHPMTVTRINATEDPRSCVCVWMMNGEVREKVLPEKCLTVISENDLASGLLTEH